MLFGVFDSFDSLFLFYLFYFIILFYFSLSMATVSVSLFCALLSRSLLCLYLHFCYCMTYEQIDDDEDCLKCSCCPRVKNRSVRRTIQYSWLLVAILAQSLLVAYGHLSDTFAVADQYLWILIFTCMYVCMRTFITRRSYSLNSHECAPVGQTEKMCL